MIAPQGRRKLERYLTEMLSPEGNATLSSRMRLLIDDLRAEWAELDRRIDAFDSEFLALARADAAGAAAHDEPRHWRAQRHGADRRDRQWRDLREGTRSRGLARAGAAPSHDRRQAASARDQQTWQQVFA